MRKGCVALIFLTVAFLTGVTVAFIINNDFGRLEVKSVKITDGEHYISGILYRPHAATEENPLPAVVLVHGISSAKESMSSIALELARRGFVTLSIDVVGHGDSGGRLGATKDPSLGALAALRHVETLPYVDASTLGLVGHSLGAGAVRAAAAAHQGVKATVLIAGGLGGIASNPSAYGVLNTTFPRNLLVAIGRQDVLFNLNQVIGELLPPVFGVPKISLGTLYGDFTSGTARKLVAPATTHLLEPLDPTIVSETVVWMSSALKPSEPNRMRQLEEGLTYPYRETAMLLSIVSLIGLTFPVSMLISPRKPSNTRVEEHGSIRGWKIMVIWGALGVALLLPTFILGFSLPFPPVLFGSSIAWWLLMVAIAGGFLILFVIPRFSGIRLSMRRLAAESFTLRETCAAVSMFLMLYAIVALTHLLLDMNLWIFVPIFKVLNTLARIILFLSFIPFFLVFFYVEGIYLHILREGNWKRGFLPEAIEMLRTIAVKITPYILVMGMQYIPMFLLEVKPLTSFLGFLIEFLPLITVLFIISTACSWWLYRVTSSIGMGTVFNALLFAWVSAGVFPFGALG
ncbi:MAG: alpha/beta fold hydrolase [Crenarchaeota archaeon]|nr:alpha/beta fold hydrolase [Thermoproteota archaeon]